MPGGLECDGSYSADSTGRAALHELVEPLSGMRNLKLHRARTACSWLCSDCTDTRRSPFALLHILDNGPEFTAVLVRRWLAALAVQTLFLEPGRPWENGYVESFNGKLRDELLDREIFYTLTEAKVLIEQWRRQYNTVRPHRALGSRPPAPEATMRTPNSGVIMSPALS